MLIIYRTLVGLALILGSPYLLVKALFGRHGIRQRFGFIEKRESPEKLVWFHAASVGELKIIQSVLPKMIERDGNLQFAVSTTTITGMRRARELFGDRAYIFLQPLELKSSIVRVIARLGPEMLVIVETEIWPLMLTVSHELGVKLFLINARMKESSFGKYRLIKPLFAPALRRFSRVLAQTSDDAERFRRLGAENVTVAGNLKYDQILDKEYTNSRRLSIEKKGKMVFVAGSVRKGEDAILADVISKIIQSELNVGFILVPRHMKEIDDMAGVLGFHGIKYRLRSDMAGDMINLDSVLIVNTMGELRDFYSLADLAFVGGSLVPIGGHDPLEPAALGKPVIFGPYMDNAREAALLLLKSGGAFEVNNCEDILKIIRKSIPDRRNLEAKGLKCRQAILSMTGASERTVRYLMGESN